MRNPKHNSRPRQKSTVGDQKEDEMVIAEAIIRVAERCGRDGHGKDGVVGYLKRIASDEPKLFCTLLARVLALKVSDEDIEPIEENTVMTRDELIAELERRGLPTSFFGIQAPPREQN